jgi:hypothetical protein
MKAAADNRLRLQGLCALCHVFFLCSFAAVHSLTRVTCRVSALAGLSHAHEQELAPSVHAKQEYRTHGYGTKTVMPAYATASSTIGPSLWAHYNADLLTPQSKASTLLPCASGTSSASTTTGFAASHAGRHQEVAALGLWTADGGAALRGDDSRQLATVGGPGRTPGSPGFKHLRRLNYSSGARISERNLGTQRASSACTAVLIRVVCACLPRSAIAVLAPHHPRSLWWTGFNLQTTKQQLPPRSGSSMLGRRQGLLRLSCPRLDLTCCVHEPVS